jgi:hypothetical protein
MNKFESGIVKITDRPGSGRPVAVLTPTSITDLVDRLEHNPRQSANRLSLETGISATSVRRALHKLAFHPYRPRMVHGLLEDDSDRRVEYAERMLALFDQNETIVDRIIWTDEAKFHLDDP